MGVADNRTYKNEYLFNDKHNSVFRNPYDTAKDNPSINVDPKINSSIKENPDKANVEIEGKEVVLQPDLSALFNAVGKRHSKGGMDVFLKPDAFIFSDFEDLKLSEQDHDLFELKKGGKKSSNTPADVLKRNVDLKHYNGLVTNLGDPFKDDLAKKSSVRMLEKYIATLGKVAYVQEEKKEFPQGVPDFALDSAPVYNTDLKNEIMENKQYAKAGGTVNNPYMQRGGSTQPQTNESNYSKFVYGSDGKIIGIAGPDGKIIQKFDFGSTGSLKSSDNKEAFKNPSSLYDGISGDIDPAIKAEYEAAVADAKKGIKNSDSYFRLQQKFHELYPDKAKQILSEYNVTNYGKTQGYGKDNLLSNVDKLWGPRTKRYLETIGQTKPVERPSREHTIPDLGNPHILPNKDKAPVIPNQEYTPQDPLSINPQFTPDQRRSSLFNWGQWLNVQKGLPMRSRFNATFTNPALVNPEQAVGDAKGMAYQQINSANVLNPILRNAQSSQAYGQALNTIPGIRTQYDNQNAGIINQFRQYNNQVKNNESIVNMQNDAKYNQESVTADTNYRNMKNYLANQAMSTDDKMRGDNQKLAWNLLTQDDPRYGFDFATGTSFKTNPKSILDVNSQDGTNEMQELLKGLDINNFTPDQKLKYIDMLLKRKGLNLLSTSSNPFNTGKKGGMMKRNKNPYK